MTVRSAAYRRKSSGLTRPTANCRGGRLSSTQRPPRLHSDPFAVAREVAPPNQEATVTTIETPEPPQPEPEPDDDNGDE